VAVSSAEFEAISPGLPSHQDEIMTAHQGAPPLAVQDQTHGVGIPAVDLGPEPGTVIGGTPASSPAY